MTCPICGEKTKVRVTRLENDCVRRVRMCLSCKYIFATTEIEEDLLQKITIPREEHKNDDGRRFY